MTIDLLTRYLHPIREYCCRYCSCKQNGRICACWRKCFEKVQSARLRLAQIAVEEFEDDDSFFDELINK